MILLQHHASTYDSAFCFDVAAGDVISATSLTLLLLLLLLPSSGNPHLIFRPSHPSLHDGNIRVKHVIPSYPSALVTHHQVEEDERGCCDGPEAINIISIAS
jgi:hypothetical protein